jgi:hypothetical protein
MLTNLALPTDDRSDDADEEQQAEHDYAWMVTLGVVLTTEPAWRSFRAGYAAGGKIGRRRYRTMELGDPLLAA